MSETSKPKVLPDGRVATGIPGQYLTPQELHENHSNRTLWAVGFGIALPVIAVALRLVARRSRRLPLWWDDYMIIVAMAFTIANSCVPIIANNGGNGRHMVTLTPTDLDTYFLGLFIFEQTFGVAICTVKLSVLLLYRRIFETRRFKLYTTIVGGLTIMWLVVKNLVGAFQCQPVRKAWIKSTPGHCSVNFINTVLAAQAFNTLFDIIILIMPIWRISKLNLSRRRRLGIIAIFGVGIFTIVVSLLRLGIIASEVLKYGPNLPDVTWFTSKFSWTVMDPAVGCFVACMPTWAPLAKPLKAIPDYFTSLRESLMRWSGRSRFRSSSGRHPHSRESEDGINLGDLRANRMTTTIHRIDSSGSSRPLSPKPGAVHIRHEFRQEEHRLENGNDVV